MEDGAEPTYERHKSVLEEPIGRLAVFQQRQSRFVTGEPNLMPDSVMEMLEDAGFDRDTIEGGA